MEKQLRVYGVAFLILIFRDFIYFKVDFVLYKNFIYLYTCNHLKLSNIYIQLEQYIGS